MIDQVTQTMQLVMNFSLLASVLMLLAALQATTGKHRYNSTVLRTLSTHHSQLRSAILVKFSALGLLATTLAITTAAVISTMIKKQTFRITLTPDWLRLLLDDTFRLTLSLLAGWSNTRHILSTPPTLALHNK